MPRDRSRRELRIKELKIVIKRAPIKRKERILEDLFRKEVTSRRLSFEASFPLGELLALLVVLIVALACVRKPFFFVPPDTIRELLRRSSLDQLEPGGALAGGVNVMVGSA